MPEITSEKIMMNVYILSPKVKDMAIDDMLQLHKTICGRIPELETEAFLFHSGPELENAMALADVLERCPENSVIILSDGYDFIRASYGPGIDCLAPVIKALHTYNSMTSYEIIRTIGEITHA